jgi:uncharacterized membrane protein
MMPNRRPMQLIAIGYPDMFTAAAAVEELERLEGDFIIRRDEVATIVRDDRGAFRIETHAPIVQEVARAGLEPEFAERVRLMVGPRTSALFVLIEKVTPEEIVAALDEYGGTVLQSEIPPHAEVILQQTLTGASLVA